MDFKKHQNILPMLSALFITFQLVYCVYGDEATEGTLKTIKISDIDIIDCVDIYKQPAFSNPLIKDLRREPSNYPFGNVSNSNLTLEMLQDWPENEECPEGTIPIRRDNISNYLYRTKSPPAPINQSLDVRSGHEYAVVDNQGSNYYGASGIFNIWNPKVEDNELSLSQMWIVTSYDKSDYYKNFNSIETGWIVYPKLLGDRQTRFFIYWTRDGYKNTGCYNLNCGGFVQTNKRYTIGMPTRSSPNGGQGYEVTIHVFKDKKGDWWLQMQNEMIGYWPGSIFTDLADHANIVDWGGEIMNFATNNRHTSTQMGSGGFPYLGFRKSCYIRNLKVLDSGSVPRNPGYLKKFVTKPQCYDLSLTKNKGLFETFIFFGGPGYSPTCQ